MPILDMQRRLRELGRIRAGDKSEKGAPRKLTSWRLTSPQQALLNEAAELWGGKVTPWQSPAGNQWQLYTETDTLRIVIPGDQAITQWYELWSGGGCQRRCDGQTEMLSDSPCMCDPDPEQRECKPTTRLNVMLPDLSDLGQWRLESHGFYAATELAGIADFLALANAQFVPARLRLEPREVKRPGSPTKKFIVPVIETDVQLGKVLEAVGAGTQIGTTAAPHVLAESDDAPALAPPPTALPVERDGEAEAALIELLGPDPDPSATMDVLEADLRKLYRLMEQAGYWPADSLHVALKRDGAEHVSDLRKAELVKFCERSWEWARQKMMERPFEDSE